MQCSISMEMVTSDPNIGPGARERERSVECSGLSSGDQAGPALRAFTETRSGERRQKRTAAAPAPAPPVPPEPELVSPHRVGPPPTSGHLQLSSARCAGRSHRPCVAQSHNILLMTNNWKEISSSNLDKIEEGQTIERNRVH